MILSTVKVDAMPLVTVIIASYNHASYIEASINSVLAQTYPRIELLVVDDGSTDGSVEVLRKMAAVHSFDLKIQENQGLSRTLNETISRALGSLIVPFGSDDIMFTHRIEAQVAYMQGKPEVGICSANIEIIDQDGQVMEVREQRKRHLPFRRLDFNDLFLDLKPGPMAATLMIRREALEKTGGFDPEIRLEDLYIELAIAHAGYFIDVLGEPLAQYRKHPTNTYKNQRFMFDNVLKTYEKFQDHPNYEQVCMRFRNSMVLKCAKRNKGLALEILRQIPFQYWNKKTIRGIWRIITA